MTAGARVTVVGYASLDYPMALGEFRGGDATSLVTARLGADWPGIGGSAHLARAVRRAGVAVDVISWIGPDAQGAAWTDALVGLGADCSAVTVSGTRSPSSYLFYTPAQGTVCIYDPGDCHDAGISVPQRESVGNADWCVIAVGPAAATRSVLHLLPQDARLVWAVKQDVEAFPPDLISALLARAAVVSLSEGEREFLTEDGVGPEERCAPGTVIVETRGARGVTFSRITAAGKFETGTIEVEPVVGTDTTGAGDMFIGTLAALLAGIGHPGQLDWEVLASQVRAAANVATATIRTRAVASPEESNHVSLGEETPQETNNKERN